MGKSLDRALDREHAAEDPAAVGSRWRRWSYLGISAIALAGVASYGVWLVSQPPSDALFETGGSNASSAAVGEDIVPLADEDFSPNQTRTELTASLARLAGRVVEAYPQDARAHSLQGKIFTYLGQPEAAERSWQACLRFDPGHPEAYFGLAELALNRADTAAAERLLRKSLESYADFPEAVRKLAELLMQTGRTDEAVTLLGHSARFHPTDAETQLLLGNAQLQQGLFEQARDSFEAVVKADPTHDQGFSGLGAALTRLGKPEEARKYLEKSTKLQAAAPEDPQGAKGHDDDAAWSSVECADALLAAAQIYHRHGRNKTALELSRRAVALDPQSIPGQLFLLSIYEESEQLAEALRACQSAVEANPRSAELIWQLGVLNATARRFEAAEAQFKQVIELVPEQASGYAGLAKVHLELKRGEEALQLAREAIRLNPIAFHYMLLGRCYVQTGDLERARAAFEEAVRLEPDNARYRLMRDGLPTAQ